MSTNPDPNTQPDAEAPLVSHLIEMRDRMLRVVIAVLSVFVVLFTFADSLYEFVSLPIREVLPEDAKMIVTGPIDQFLTPMKLAMYMAIYIAMPVILYQLWAFVAPALYRHEKKLVAPLMASSIILFYLGMAFAYFVVFPIMFDFMAGITLTGVEMAPDIKRYLDIVLKLFFAFGVAFEVPIATILLVWTGMTSAESLAQKRPYIIVGAFVLGMLLTPPDMISQTLLAIPMWMLFELGLLASRYFVKQKGEAEDGLDSDEAMEAELDRYESEEAALDSSEKDNGAT
jgi:sec-independent protein translocase protein TatC